MKNHKKIIRIHTILITLFNNFIAFSRKLNIEIFNFLKLNRINLFSKIKIVQNRYQFPR
jgi:hypothetical protein